MKTLELPQTGLASFLAEIDTMTDEKYLQLCGEPWSPSADSRNLKDDVFYISDEVPWEMFDRKEWAMRVEIMQGMYLPLDDEYYTWGRFHEGYRPKIFISIKNDALKEAVISALEIECYEIDDVSTIEDQISSLFHVCILRVNSSEVETIHFEEW